MSGGGTGQPLGPGREFDRIRAILARLGPVARGIGGDWALVPEGPGRLIASSDMSVEGRHFRREWLSLEEIGWRATAAALSDLAAGGATAAGAMVSVGVPPAAGDAELVALMGGAGDALAAAGAVLLGGDLSASERWIVDVTVLGRAERPVSRNGARPGDGLWVSGALGGARAALVQWQAGREPDPGSRQRFAHPLPRLAAGRALAGAGARAMLDLSDGLGGDAGHLAAASGVGLEIDLARLPLDAGVAAAAELEGVAAPVFAGRGGEDYELLAAMPAEFGDQAARALAGVAEVSVTRIGTVVAEPGVRFRLGGALVELAGFDHFS